MKVIAGADDCSLGGVGAGTGRARGLPTRPTREPGRGRHLLPLTQPKRSPRLPIGARTTHRPAADTTSSRHGWDPRLSRHGCCRAQVIEIYGSRNLSLIFGGVEPSEVLMLLPVGRHRAGRTRHGLIQRMAPRLGELRAAREIASPVVVEPILAGLEALDHGMSRLPAVCAGVLARRVVTAADVAARRATQEVKPPAGLGAGQTLCAPTTARWHIGVDVVG